MSSESFVFNLSLIDSKALMMTITGYGIVLASLAFVAFLFIRLHSIQDFLERRRMKKDGHPGIPEKPRTSITGEENAAIATALYLFFAELHDEEKYVMTIRKVSRNYSPWSSKIYGVYKKLK